MRVATVQFSEGSNPRRNASLMARYMQAARRQRADVVHFHEGALSGYLAAVTRSDYDWHALRDAASRLASEAARLRLWVVLGSAHRLTPPHRPHNSLYVINPDGKLLDRYDKRFLMPDELAVYTPGNRPVTVQIDGVRCGLLICFDLRFPELYRELMELGVKVLFQSFNNGRMDGPGIHEHIMRQTVQAHAAISGMWISAANSSAYYSRWPSVAVRPDGFIENSLQRNRAGMMVTEIDLSRKLYDPIGENRRLAAGGQLHNGRLVRDSRSDNRREF
jgi:predicted amidohydrolase